MATFVMHREGRRRRNRRQVEWEFEVEGRKAGERVQEETGEKGDCTEEERAGGQDGKDDVYGAKNYYLSIKQRLEKLMYL